MSGIKRMSFDVVENFDKEIISMINGDNCCIGRVDEHEKIVRVVRNIYNNDLTPHQRMIYKMYYADGKNSRIIAEELNVSPQAVTKCLRKIRCRIARLMKLYI